MKWEYQDNADEDEYIAYSVNAEYSLVVTADYPRWEWRIYDYTSPLFRIVASSRILYSSLAAAKQACKRALRKLQAQEGK